MTVDMERTPFHLTNSAGIPIRGDVYAGEDPRPGAAIVVCHGFKGFKDWGYFPYTCQELARRTGYPTIAFNFSGSGIGEDLLNFTELDLFRANTFTKELDDLALVLDSAQHGDLPELSGVERFGLLGHSRGGGIAVLKASEDHRVECLVTWAATADFNRWSEETRRQWREEGVVEVLNTRTEQLMPLGLELLEDTEKNAERLDITAAAARLRIFYLVIHGTDDESVPAAEAKRLADAAPHETTRLELIENTGHTFDAVHPFAGTTPALEKVIGLSADWLEDALDEEG